MTSIKITNDDVGIRALQESNKSPVVTGPVMPVKASNPVQKSPQNMPLNPAKTNAINSEAQQSTHRRKFDRRKIDSSVLLETRSQHDRRTQNRQTDDDMSKELETLHGIDEIV